MARGAGRKPGKGTGGEGQGRGGNPPEKQYPTGLEKKRIPGQIGKGKIVGRYSVKGEPPEGKAKAEFRKIASEAREEALEALSRQKVPSSYRDYVRDYFDAIRGENAATPEK